MMRITWCLFAIFLFLFGLMPRGVDAQNSQECQAPVDHYGIAGISLDSQNLSVIGHRSPNIRVVAEKDDYLYTGANREFAVIDARDPSALVRTGFVLMPESIQDVAVKDNYAYVALFQNGLYIVDISNPRAPKIVGVCDLPSGPGLSNLVVDGDYVFAIGYYSILLVIDVSTPSAPRLVAHLESPDFVMYVSDIIIAAPYLYVANRQSGLAVIDISDPAAPRRVGLYYAPGDQMNDLYLRGNLLYVANGVKGLRILDVASPATPKEIGRYWPLGGVNRVEFSGEHALVQMGENARWDRVDVSNPVEPRRVGPVDVLIGAWEIFAADQRVYALMVYGVDQGLTLIDFSVVDTPQVVSRYGKPLYLSQSVYASGYLFTASEGSRTLSVFDVNDPTSPKWIVDYPFTDLRFTVVDNTLYTAGAGLSLIDVSDVSTPAPIGYHYLPDSNYSTFQDVVVDLPYAYATSRGYLYIIDVSTPAEIKEVAHLKIHDALPLHLALMGDSVVLASDGKVFVVDVSTITAPVLVATVSDTGSGYGADVVTVADYAYVAWKYRQEAPYQGISILSLADRDQPVQVRFVETPPDINAMTIEFPFLYITWGSGPYGGIQVFDISYPAQPVQVAHYNRLQGWARQVAVNGNYVYVPDLDLLVLEQDRTARARWLHLPTVSPKP